MHLVLVNNNITATSSDEKTLSSFLLYLRAYSLDGVSIGTAFFFVFSLIPSLFFSFSSSSSSSFKHIYASRAFFFLFFRIVRSARSVDRCSTTTTTTTTILLVISIAFFFSFLFSFVLLLGVELISFFLF